MIDLDFRPASFREALDRLVRVPGLAPEADEGFWAAVASLYETAGPVVNLENGYWGAMAAPVHDVYRHWTDRVNAENSLLIRPHWAQAMEDVRQSVAAALGCGADEIALTRGATEAMLALISGYNRLAPGDVVLYSDLDYPAMRHAMEWLRERRGAVPVQVVIPEPATPANVLETYAQALARHPRTRLVLLTHVSHCTGLVLPIRALTAMVRAAGAEAVVDAAHAWGQLDFDVGSLGASFVAFNLHKWVGAPLGCGCLYIGKQALGSIDRYFGDQEYPEDDVRSRIHTGSPNFAAWLSIPAALELHQRISAGAKAARLRRLRDHWVNQLRGRRGIDILTPDDPGGAAGITSFRLGGRTSAADNEAIVATLREVHGVFTVRRHGPARGDVVRVTPAVYTSVADMDRLVAGLDEMLGAMPGR